MFARNYSLTGTGLYNTSTANGNVFFSFSLFNNCDEEINWAGHFSSKMYLSLSSIVPVLQFDKHTDTVLSVMR